MAIPPDTESFKDEGELELQENAFTFSGVSLEYLKPFRVFDLTRGGQECQVKLEQSLAERIQGEEILPGSVYSEGSIKVVFNPAERGHRYRCTFSGGERSGVLRPPTPR